MEVTNYRLGDALFRRQDVREPMSTRKLNIPIAIDPDISHPPPAPIEVDDGSHRPSNVDLAHPFPSGLQPSQSHRDVHHVGDDGYDTHEDDDDLAGPKLTPICVNPETIKPVVPMVEKDDGSHRPAGIDPSHPFPSAQPVAAPDPHRDVHHAGEDGYDTHEDDDDAAGPKLTPICVNPETVTPVVPVVEKDDGAHRPSNVADPAHPFSSGESAAPVPHRDIHHAGDAGYETHDSEDDC